MSKKVVVLAPSRPVSDESAQQIQTFLAKADCLPVYSALDRFFADDLLELTVDDWPAAALTRQFDVGDADDVHWLRADPAHFRVEIANVRMLACGDVGQSEQESAQLVAALAPFFGDEGFELSAPHASRWYLRAFASNAAQDFPSLVSPEMALGHDLFELWPEDGIHRRWRRIFNETQIVLAQHPVNRERVRRGQPAINGLWFWGAGRLPKKVSTKLSAVITTDHLLSALSALAGTVVLPAFDPNQVPSDGDVLIDLRHANAADDDLRALLQAWEDGRIHELEWRSPSGRWLRKRWHRWRFWR